MTTHWRKIHSLKKPSGSTEKNILNLSNRIYFLTTKGTAVLYNKTKRKPGNTPSFLIVSWEVIEWDRFTLLTKELCKSKIEENFPYRDTVLPKQSRIEQGLLNEIKTFNIIGEGNFIFQDRRVGRGDPQGDMKDTGIRIVSL